MLTPPTNYRSGSWQVRPQPHHSDDQTGQGGDRAAAHHRGTPAEGSSQAQYRAIWNEAKAEVGLGADEQVVPHILRHTCASRLVQGGIDIRRVQMWLGHQTLSMTMRYAHL